MNMHYFGSGWNEWSFINMPLFMSVFGLLMLWSLFWKGLGLWHSARRGEPWWFVAILLINTAGILEIVYLFGFAKLKLEQLFSHGSHGHHP